MAGRVEAHPDFVLWLELGQGCPAVDGMRRGGSEVVDADPQMQHHLLFSRGGRPYRPYVGLLGLEHLVQRVRAKIEDFDSQLLIAQKSVQVVGTFLMEPHDIHPNWWYVSMVFVDPEYQGRGVGSALLAAAVPHAPSPPVLSLWTRDSNNPARRLYTVAGFAENRETGSTLAEEPTHRWQWGGVLR